MGVVASREGEERATESVDEAVIGDIETFLQEMVEQFGREQPAAVGGMADVALGVRRCSRR